jgi:NADH-quinone oxidoreductase subunit M
MVILSSFKANFWFAFLAGTTLILGAAYTLWMIKRVIYGDIGNEKVAALTDINRREFFFLLMLALMVLLIGIWPAPLLEVMEASADNLLQQMMHSKL